jgi:hypothetical protein
MTQQIALDRRICRATWLTTAGLLASVIGNLHALGAAHSLWAVPPGSAIRPMDVALAVCISTLFTPLVSIPLAVSAVWKGKRVVHWVLSAVTVTLAFLPWTVSRWYVDFIAATNNLTFKP